MALGVPGGCLLVGLCVLLPPTPTRGGPQDPTTPQIGGEQFGDPQLCDITFHTPNPCGPRGPPSSSSSSSSRAELEHLQNLLRATKAKLKDVETAATLEDNGTRYQDIITQALPAIRGANQEFGESLDNVRRELEAHVAQGDHPRVAEKKEKLQEGVRLVAHMLRLTGHLAQSLDVTSQHLLTQLSRRPRGWATPGPTAVP